MPDKIQLYSVATPNGQKVGVALEEMNLSYDAHTIDIRTGDQHTPEFLALNPNGKIPAIVDPQGPGGTPLTLFESGAILVYLAEKTGQFLPSGGLDRYHALQWTFFQMAQVGPMFGQFGHFYALAGKEHCDHPYPVQRYTDQVNHTLQVLEGQLQQHSFLAGEEYTIADIATFPWVGCLDWAYSANEHLHMRETYPFVTAWYERCIARPAAARGLTVCPFPEQSNEQ